MKPCIDVEIALLDVWSVIMMQKMLASGVWDLSIWLFEIIKIRREPAPSLVKVLLLELIYVLILISHDHLLIFLIFHLYINTMDYKTF